MVDRAGMIEAGVNRILTQYRESPNFIALLRHGLAQVADVIERIDAIPEAFDIETAIGDQLTIIGKRLGWPRCHCVCDVVPVFGFQCPGETPSGTIVGFCAEGSASWANCQPAGRSEICFDDDEVYRRYLLVRRFQALQEFDLESLELCVRTLWGDAAKVFPREFGRVAVSAGRPLTTREERELQLAFRVLPFAPGMKLFFSRQNGPIAGFGTGWAGFCEDAQWFCPEPVNPYDCFD